MILYIQATARMVAPIQTTRIGSMRYQFTETTCPVTTTLQANPNASAARKAIEKPAG